MGLARGLFSRPLGVGTLVPWYSCKAWQRGKQICPEGIYRQFQGSIKYGRGVWGSFACHPPFSVQTGCVPGREIRVGSLGVGTPTLGYPQRYFEIFYCFVCIVLQELFVWWWLSAIPRQPLQQHKMVQRVPAVLVYGIVSRVPC